LSKLNGRRHTSSQESPLWPSWAFIKALVQRHDVDVFFLTDGNDRKTFKVYFDRLRQMGCSAQAFPERPFDIWRGNWAHIVERLLPIAHAESDSSPYSQFDVEFVLRLVGDHPDGSPRSTPEFLQRLDSDVLVQASGSRGATPEFRAMVETLQMRYRAFFASCEGDLDVGWSWENARVGFLDLGPFALNGDWEDMQRLLLDDLADYLRWRKQSSRRCIVLACIHLAEQTSPQLSRVLNTAQTCGASVVVLPARF
jgi:hypothetical protein